MRIESVASQQDRVGRYRVCFENGEVIRLYRQTVEDFGLYTGRDLTDEELDKLRTAAGKMSAKMRAVRIVAASSVSKRDLEQRLVSKGEDPEQAREAVEWMAELSLVDDEKTAETVVQRCISKGYGISRAKQALYEKRIPKKYWDAALTDYPDQSEHILSFLRARLDGEAQERDIKKAVDALLRKGHNYSEIRRGLEQLRLDFEDFREE